MDILQGKHRPIELFRYAGLFLWFCAGIPLLLMRVIYPEPVSFELYVAWFMLHGLFGLLYWHLMQYLPERTAISNRIVYLSLLTACALGISAVSQSLLGGILLLIVSVVLPWMLSLVPAVSWLIAQNVLLAITLSRIPEVSLSDASTNAGMLLGISMFAFMSSVVVLRQNAARDELRRVNSELQATQSLLAENTRIAERVRIARELHDLVGHHLTALTLNLEVVTHLVDGKVLEHVQQAHSLARLLLADVREVVSDMRRDDMVNLADALHTLIEGVPKPKIHLDLPYDEVMTEPQRAQVLLRCVQEMITNSVRHAQAENLWIRLSMTRDGLAMSARDDGIGADKVAVGNGLMGMAERLKQLGGKLEIESEPGTGFALHAWLPTKL
ncbi:MAG: sensor histidine kinase [Xanthomonadales bacterium]|nr:sensor histidine kinase [Gammaproteobacteria bacterium]MBT8074693.1 sensor histidine kinase [Gammaproteobacteria bacterium]MBT8076188.1 sensor histidine kinase [Gammaproteobacteria bacterium]NNK05546.1 sensor histidine kinase [Xanthomonadales bacterium]NNK99067.1 sensor histidine kinase [Xanthomonadales bacterium]